MVRFLFRAFNFLSNLGTPEFRANTLEKLTSIDIDEGLTSQRFPSLRTLISLQKNCSSSELERLESWISPHIQTLLFHEIYAFVILELFLDGNHFFEIINLYYIGSPELRLRLIEQICKVDASTILSRPSAAKVIEGYLAASSIPELASLLIWIAPNWNLIGRRCPTGSLIVTLKPLIAIWKEIEAESLSKVWEQIEVLCKPGTIRKSDPSRSTFLNPMEPRSTTFKQALCSRLSVYKNSKEK